MKIMTKQQLIDRGLKKGDIYYTTSNNDESFRGWYLIFNNEGQSVGLNTERAGAWDSNTSTRIAIERGIEKVILTEEFERNLRGEKLGRFLRDFNEEDVKTYITKIEERKMCKYIKGVHFGNKKEYTWRIVESWKDGNSIIVGDIVEVFTSKGRQLVEVTEVYEDYFNEKHNTVNRIILHS